MNNLKALSAGLLFTFLFSFSAQAQQNAYKKGTILVDEKKSIDAYIQIDFRFPQRFQSSVTYLSPEAYEKLQQNIKLKKKDKKSFKPKEIIGFDLEGGKSFRTVRYTNLNSNSTLGMPKKLCLEQVVKGKIDLYKMYSHTTGKISNEIIGVVNASVEENDESILIDYIQDNFQLLVQKDSDNPKNLMEVSLLNYFGDDASVKVNYTKNHYGFRDEFTEKQSGVIVDQKFEAAFLRLLNDYETGSESQLTK